MSIVKLQIPIEASVRDGLAKRADQLGFDSIQAFIRFWAKAEIDGRQVDYGDDPWGQPSPEAAARLNRWADEGVADSNAGKLKSYTSVDEMMEHLRSL